MQCLQTRAVSLWCATSLRFVKGHSKPLQLAINRGLPYSRNLDNLLDRKAPLIQRYGLAQLFGVNLLHNCRL